VVRVALYTRVSTEDQAKEGFSLDAQLERLRFFAKAQGWEVAGEYVDEGHSGRTTKRPQYARMMEERPRWDILLVLKMDRIHRNSRNFMAMMDQLRKEGKEFASVTESLDTSTAMGRFVMDIIQRIAQLESEQIGERVYIGMEQKAKQRGNSLGKEAPFGYRYRPDRVLEPVPEERAFAEGIFRRYLAGASSGEVATWLTSAGAKMRRGGAWTRQRVLDILANPTYAGAAKWDGVLQLATHEGVVDPKTFDAAQDRLAVTNPAMATVRLTRLQVA
jgi:DNA invertase Pin-like site-specific DNA recombinase